MPLKVTFDIAQNSARWTDADIRAIKKAIRGALLFISHSRVRGNPGIPGFAGMTKVGVGITLTTNHQIQKLNAKWRKKNQPTNVLSFPSGALENITDYPEKIPVPLGDVVLAYETCAREAKDYGIKFNHYIMFLVVHGTLHLLGYDHETDAQHRQMIKTELVILKQLGLANPYPFMHN
jgi:probable rRNA maturation factor